METFGTLRLTARSQAPPDVFDRQNRIDWWSQETLRQAKVMVVGAGAIGNETLKNLALLGVGYLLIVDFDTVADSNLSRTVLFRREDVGSSKAEVAAARTRELCLEPNARVKYLHGDLVWELGTGVFRQMDVVLGCVDNVEARLAINRQCALAGVPWIDAGIDQLAGHVSIYQPGTACYLCTASEAQLGRARQRYSCDNFKRRAMAEGRVPTVQVTSSFVASLQSQEAIKTLHGRQAQGGKKLIFQGTINDFDVLDLPRRPDCPDHFQLPEVTSLSGSSELALSDHLENLVSRFGPGVSIDLSAERSFIRRVRCRSCGDWIRMNSPEHRVFEDDAFCSACRNAGEVSERSPDQPAEKEIISQFSLDRTPRDILALSLAQLGIPPVHIVPIRLASGSYLYGELSDDLENLLPGLHPAGNQEGEEQ